MINAELELTKARIGVILEKLHVLFPALQAEWQPGMPEYIYLEHIAKMDAALQMLTQAKLLKDNGLGDTDTYRQLKAEGWKLAFELRGDECP